MNQLKIFINLTRLNKPIGFMLLFWPCSWGIAYAFQKNQDFKEFILLISLFFLGSVLMRSAGCIFNDIIDKDFDKKVERTKSRPIASGQISIQRSFFYIILLCSLAFIILMQFNFLTILLGLGSMFFAFSYPFMKRCTYWPQLFLGLTFNWGIIMGWTAMTDQVSYEIVVLYVSAIFWTLGYDTIYGIQDVEDDEIIGIKSTAIKFKKNIKFFVSICYLITSIAIIYLFYKNLGVNLTTLFLAMFILSLIYQVVFFQKDNPNSCLTAFKFNNYSGMFLFFSFLFG